MNLLQIETSNCHRCSYEEKQPEQVKKSAGQTGQLRETNVQL